MYASPQVMDGEPYTKKDDLVSIVYVLLKMLNELPFADAHMDDAGDTISQCYNLFLHDKLTRTARDLTCPKETRALRPFIEEIWNYNRNTKPDYGKLKHLLIV